MPRQPAGDKPIPRVLLGVRLPRDLVSTLKIQAIQRADAGTPPTTVTAIAEEALREWLKRHGQGKGGN